MIFAEKSFLDIVKNKIEKNGVWSFGVQISFENVPEGVIVSLKDEHLTIRCFVSDEAIINVPKIDEQIAEYLANMYVLSLFEEISRIKDEIIYCPRLEGIKILVGAEYLKEIDTLRRFLTALKI